FHVIENAGHECVRIEFVSPGPEVEHETVSKNVRSESADIGKINMHTAMEEGTRLRSGDERLGSTRTGSALNKFRCTRWGSGFLPWSGCRNDAHRIRSYIVCDRHSPDSTLKCDNLIRSEDGVHGIKRSGRPGRCNCYLLLRLGVLDADAANEPVELRLRQWISALHLNGILGREHDKRKREPVSLAPQGYFAFLHRLEERCLRLGRGAIDFIREQNIGEK